MEKSRDIYVYADWESLGGIKPVGFLTSEAVRGREIFSFRYDESWIEQANSVMLDPDILPFAGNQYLANRKTNFGVFLDSSPDRWGRVLMKCREAIQAREEGRRALPLTESDYLLGVFDGTRMGGLRFKLSPDGPFLDDNKELATPPWSTIRDLEYASLMLEKDDSVDDPDYKRWLTMLLEPGSSLGGARPKANVTDTSGHLWIAKFPSGADSRDMGAWERVLNQLAERCGINVSESVAQRFSSKHHTFLSRRFDRSSNGGRIHFASAMTMLGEEDGADYNSGSSYLQLAMFLTQNGSNVENDLRELFTRIAFNVAVSNCDDHLRNHGFILTPQGWVLSPAYDLNPDPSGTGLKLNISEDDNSLDFGLVSSVAKHFRLSELDSDKIIGKVKSEVSHWNKLASDVGISRSEQELMSAAFRY